ncbi:MAG TPA: M56 family metallopeptidase, partial [Longimicrobiaceae bacterium]|nr:M56 family metallopeptidase [Longimicrobiaceae bacterium]
MSPAWMLQALLAAALLGMAALAAERVAGWFGVPRRSVWAAAMLGSLLLPALSLLAPGLLPDPGIFPAATPPVPAFDVGALPLGANGPHAIADGATGNAPAWWTDPAILFGLGWLAASLAMLGVVAWTYLRLRRACAGGVRVELDGGEVRVTERVGPAVVGLLHPQVVLPRWVLDAPGDERRLILLHEREHVAAGDAWLLFLGTLAVAAMPWSVPLWWQHRRLRAAVEADCDARVLARGASRRAYGQVLIRTAGSTSGLPLLGPAWGDSTSQLERRIMTMTARRPSHRLLRSVPLLALAAAVALTACDVAAGAEAEASLSVEPASLRVAVEARLGADGTDRVTDTVRVPPTAPSAPPAPETSALPAPPPPDDSTPLAPPPPDAPAPPALVAPPAPGAQPARAPQP